MATSARRPAAPFLAGKINLAVQFGWYLVVGGIAFLGDLAISVALMAAGAPVLAAFAAGYLAGFLINYALSILLAFQGGRFGRSAEFTRLVLVNLVGVALTALLMQLFMTLVHLSPVPAKIIAVPIVLVWSFLGRRIFVFHKEMPESTASLSARMVAALSNGIMDDGSDPMDMGDPLIDTLVVREKYRDQYWKQRDPIVDDRMLWRAQTFRHIMHLLPGRTILEIGCGDGIFTRQLLRVSRGECPITAVTFDAMSSRPAGLPKEVEFLAASSLPGALAGRRFDYVVAHDMLDRRSNSWFLQNTYDLLAPGGEVLFYESNPWNVFLRLRRRVMRLAGRGDPRQLPGRSDMYELLSEVGFSRLFAVYNDFVYAPLSRRLVWMLRNLSIVLENVPGVRTLSGSILVHAQKPPRPAEAPKVSLPGHDALRRAVSVVVPCHNEEMNVRPLVSRLLGLFDQYIHEIVLVDDNSRDGTREVIRALAAEEPRIKPIYRAPPNGVGRAIADGLRAASGRYVLSLDCDFQHLLPEVRDLFDAISQGYDVAVGSRFSRHSVLLNYPAPKIVANRAFHVMAQIILLGRFRDLTNNLKLMRREVVLRLALHEPGFAVNAETGLQPLMMGYRIKEVPISWIGRGVDMGASSFRVFKVSGGYWRVLCELWLSRFLGIGRYGSLAVPVARGILPGRLQRVATSRTLS